MAHAHFVTGGEVKNSTLDCWLHYLFKGRNTGLFWCRSQLLRVSTTTAERFLRSQHKPAPRGLSTTQAGPLLKHQIPIRTFQQ
jgi:hypothetical protein